MSKERLLVVDDEPKMGEFVREIGDELGYDVAVTHKARDFKQQYRSFAPTTVVLDMTLPDEDGVQLLKFLKTEASNARIVVISGLDPRIRHAFDRLGDAFGLHVVANLQKPIEIETLRSALDPGTRSKPQAHPAEAELTGDSI